MTPRQMALEVLPAQGVILSQPVIRQDGDKVEISGTVQREPGYTGVLFGHVNIELIDHDGYLQDNVPAALTPRSIPTYGNQTSTYDVYVQEELPQGGTMRVSFSDDSKPSTQPGSGLPGRYMERPSGATGAGGGAGGRY